MSLLQPAHAPNKSMAEVWRPTHHYHASPDWTLNTAYRLLPEPVNTYSRASVTTRVAGSGCCPNNVAARCLTEIATFCSSSNSSAPPEKSVLLAVNHSSVACRTADTASRGIPELLPLMQAADVCALLPKQRLQALHSCIVEKICWYLVSCCWNWTEVLGVEPCGQRLIVFNRNRTRTFRRPPLHPWARTRRQALGHVTSFWAQV